MQHQSRAVTEPRPHTDVLGELVPLKGRRIADVGCGTGELVRWLRSQGADVVGIECGDAARARAIAADADHAGDYLDGVGQDLPLSDACADVVVYSYALHHVPTGSMQAALEEVRRVLRPGGVLYTVEPVAAGPSFEVVRLIDDETAVRADAQAALDRAPGADLEPVVHHGYTSRTVHPDADAMAERIVGVDPARAAGLARHRQEFERRFAQHASPVEGGYAFDQENVVRVFRRPLRA